MRLFKNASYPFIEWRKRAYLVTGLLMVLTVAAMVMNYARDGSWLNYGVDFRGGTLVQIDFRQQPMQVEQIRAAASASGHDWEITRFGSGNNFLIRMASFDEAPGQTVQDQVREALSSRFQPTQYDVVRTEAVGPKVGSELQYRALLAILLSFAATLLYLWFRFEWRFGLAAIAATAHDIVVTLGFLALLRSEISLGTVAAFLTIVGYSLNDTIVVFDRIRENLGKPRHGRSYADILNLSINETLPRTVLTGVTSLLTLTALFVFGGAVIRGFALVLILGIIIGTFSSIFVAAPVLHFLERRFPHQPAKKQQAVRSRHVERPRPANASRGA